MSKHNWSIADGCRETACLTREIDRIVTWGEQMSPTKRKALADAANHVAKAHILLCQVKES
ncbi:hypothetical protein LCGC14_1796250 [marine sediment metagenome]|uniref:Uncharacterized protein n=1 Tax=marine sediment metagenome TaxID=412755 RepID=A0A0F9JQP0_9ZZZZ